MQNTKQRKFISPILKAKDIQRRALKPYLRRITLKQFISLTSPITTK